MIGRNIVVIGASHGGVAAITHILEGLPADFHSSVFIVLHIGATQNHLPHLFGRASRLPVVYAADGDPILAGRIYLAPPDMHMMVEADRIRLVHGPKENFTRPAIDPLFRSAAKAFGSHVIGVLLTGRLNDGAAGLMAIKDAGGAAIVQDPSEAVAPSMPASALACVAVDHVCSVGQIASLLVSYDPDFPSHVPVPMPVPAEDLTDPKTIVADQKDLERLGHLSSLVCPECNAVLYQLRDDRLLRFRCQNGHAMSGAALLAQFRLLRERAIGSAITVLLEEIALMKQLGGASADAAVETAGASIRDSAALLACVAILHKMLAGLPASAANGEGAAPVRGPTNLDVAVPIRSEATA